MWKLQYTSCCAHWPLRVFIVLNVKCNLCEDDTHFIERVILLSFFVFAVTLSLLYWVNYLWFCKNSRTSSPLTYRCLDARKFAYKRGCSCFRQEKTAISLHIRRRICPWHFVSGIAVFSHIYVGASSSVINMKPLPKKPTMDLKSALTSLVLMQKKE